MKSIARVLAVLVLFAALLLPGLFSAPAATFAIAESMYGTDNPS